MPDTSWTLRLATPDDVGPTMALGRAVYGDGNPDLNERYWRWRQVSDTAFRSKIITAECDGRIIGIQPVTIFDWDWCGVRLKGAMYTNVMTHPDFRRRGVFRSLVEASNELATECGAQFSMTLPNEASWPGFIKAKWNYPGLIPLHIRITSASRAFARRIGTVPSWLAGAGPSLIFRPRGGRAVGVEFESVTRVPDALNDVVEQSLRQDDGVRLRRSADYWNWRYDATGGRAYHSIVARKGGRLIGAAAMRVGQRAGLDVGMIVDLVASDDEATAALIDGAQQRLLELGSGIVTCQASSPHLTGILRARGFRTIGPRLSRKRFHFVFRPTGVAGWPRVPVAMADWNLMFGDSDNV